MRKEFLKKLADANGDEKLIDDVLTEFEKAIQEQFIITLLIDKRNKKISEKCWRVAGCPFNSNNSPKYMKCWQDNYSIDQCKQDNQDYWKL